jgi:hypothetical protein
MTSPPFTSSELAERTLQRRAVEAAIWGMPLVNTDAMRQAYFRDVGAKYDICYFSTPADWRFQVTTPNASTNYVYFNFNLKDGPVVVEIPAAVGAGLLGSMVNAWDEPMADIGPKGEDQGKGGKYLLLPPDFKGEPPPGFFTVRYLTYNGYALYRAIRAGSTEADVAASLAMVKKLRVYRARSAGGRHQAGNCLQRYLLPCRDAAYIAGRRREPDIVEKVRKGYKAGKKTFKVYLDGYNLLPFLKGEVKENPRRGFLYWSVLEPCAEESH